MENKKKFSLSSFSIILILIAVLGIITQFLPAAEFVNDAIVDGSGVAKATLSQVLLAPILGFENAVDVAIFVLILGGFLAIVAKTGALETGIKVLVNKLKGNELILIPILMFIFSIGGTTYGMLEETVGFYALLAATMVAAGMDTLVASSIVLLGAGSGVLGSTINPFAVGAAVSALPEGIVANQGIIIGLGVALWLTSLAISIFFVMRYAAKVKKDKGSTFLSLQEQEAMKKEYGSAKTEIVTLSGSQKATLWLFGLAFLVMIAGFIPWDMLGVTFFADQFEAGKLSIMGTFAGNPLGWWWFYEAALWFTVIGIVIGIINKMSEKDIVDSFVKGAGEMISVVLIIAIARGASVLMGQTYLDNYIIHNAAAALQNVAEVVFTPLNYLLHILLSVLVPSSSGLATLSTPIMGPLANTLGYNVEISIMSFVAANGLVNLITPTCGAIMGGLALAKVEYTTWVKFAFKIVATIFVASIIILTLATVIL